MGGKANDNRPTLIERATKVLERWQMAVDIIQSTPGAYSKKADKLRELFIPKVALAKYLPRYGNDPRLFLKAANKSYRYKGGEGYIGTDVYHQYEEDRYHNPDVSEVPLGFVDANIIQYAQEVEDDARTIQPRDNGIIIWHPPIFRAGAQLEFYYTYVYCYGKVYPLNVAKATPTNPPPAADVDKPAAPIWTGPPDLLERIFTQLATRRPDANSDPLLTDAPPEVRGQWVAYWTGKRSEPPSAPPTQIERWVGYWCGIQTDLPDRPLTVRTKVGSKSILGYLLYRICSGTHIPPGGKFAVAKAAKVTFSCWQNTKVKSIYRPWLLNSEDAAPNPPGRQGGVYLDLTTDCNLQWVRKAKS